jgi:hypothetical protein
VSAHRSDKYYVRFANASIRRLKQITDSIAVLNEDYKNFTIEFSLRNKDITYTQNADWFNNLGPDEQSQTDMKNKLRRGGKKELNVYTVGFRNSSGEGLLGYATFPEWYKGAPKDDGVVMLYSSVPGGSTKNYHRELTSWTLIHAPC